jgi:hypothetical protein
MRSSPSTSLAAEIGLFISIEFEFSIKRLSVRDEYEERQETKARQEIFPCSREEDDDQQFVAIFPQEFAVSDRFLVSGCEKVNLIITYERITYESY